MRYLSLHLPFLATDRLRAVAARLDATSSPSSRSLHGEAGERASRTTPPLATIAKVKSAFRLIALDAGALALGLRPMMALADARAMHPSLDVQAADPAGDAAARDGLVDWCRRFTPLAAPDGADGAMLDISGCAHLFGGETALMDEIHGRLTRQGFMANLAVADTSGAAWALARYGAGCRRIAPAIAPSARAKIFASMPLAALRLDERRITQLGQAGLPRVGDLMLRPRAPVAARFGRDIHHRLDVLLGAARDPISPRFEAPPFVAERRFAEGLTRRETIEATILTLAHDLCGLLARHGEGARQLDVALYRVDGVVKHVEAGTSRPLRDPVAMARLFHERIEAAGEEGLDTGYGFDVIRLAALAAERLDEDQSHFRQSGWVDMGHGDAGVADLIDRLGARFGLGRVSRLAIAGTHHPEAASIAVPVGSKAAKTSAAKTSAAKTSAAKTSAAKTSAAIGEGDHLPERPIRLFEQPEPIDTVAEVPEGLPMRFRWRRVTHQIAAIEGPERIGPAWWRQGQENTRDYFRAEDTEGRRFWLYREGLCRETAAPRWFLHGLFA